MTNLEQKSEFNLEAAKLLVQNGWHAPSIHCSYYSILQKCKVIFCIECNLTESQYESRESQFRGKGGSHVFLFKEIRNLFKNKTKNIDDLRAFENWFNDLKRFRENSDYKNVYISDLDSDKALRISNNIIQKLNGLF